MNKDFYISLITKKLSNELNAAELKDLSTWLSESKANTVTSGQFKETWDLTKNYKSSVSFDAGTAFQSFAKKYEIPTSNKVANTKPKSKLGVKKYILIFALLMLTSAFIGALIFNSVFKGTDTSSIANNEMHAQTFALNDAINVTVAPNSKFEKGVYTIQRKDNNTSSKSTNNNNSGGFYTDESDDLSNSTRNNSSGKNSKGVNSSGKNSTGNNSSGNNSSGNSSSGTNSSGNSNSSSSNNNSSYNNNFSSKNSSTSSSSSSSSSSSNNNSNNNFNSNSSATDYSVENFYGQGYFDVNVPAGMKPAKIEIEDDRYIETENATFNLQNYEEDDFSVIDVQTGSIKFVAGENVLNITEGQRLIYNEKSGNYKTVKLPELNPFKWHKGVLVFDNTPLDEAFSMIERFYGVNINVKDDSNLDGHPFTVTLYKGTNLNECLELLSETIPMQIERVGDRDVEVSNVKRKQ
ncbi:DUF4974 domain-containing protein [Saprospiraceae bacterium]|nr:DUF4974 domain-containing protein [Saprospiraceae bacterium]